MLRDLLLRDWIHHRRVLLAATALPLLLLATMVLAPESEATGQAAILWLLGLLVLALLPLSLHLREGKLGTLPALLVLPVPRRDVVRLRFVEGLAACAGFTLVYLGGWILLRHPSAARVLELALSPAPLWVLLIFLAFPAPFVLRWGGSGLLVAFALLLGGLFGWAFLVVYGSHLPGLGWAVRLEGWAHRLVVPPSLATALDWGGPLLLACGFYRLSCRVIERVDA